MPLGRVGQTEFFYTAEAVEQIGRSKSAILRWIREGRNDSNGIKDVQRDYRGYRIWTKEDIERFRRFAAEQAELIVAKRRGM